MRTRADIEGLYRPSNNKHQSRMVSGGRERLTFRHDRRWCGFFVFLVPVMLPICTTYDRFYLKGDRVVKAKYREIRMLGIFCHFPFPLPDGKGSHRICSTKL